MRRLLIISAAILCSILGLTAQNTTLTTQAEVDAWDQSITELTGTVTISGNDITNIDALSNLSSIIGTLDIDELEF